MENLVASDKSPEPLLTLTEVAQRTGWKLEALRGYVRDTPLNAHIGARPKPGSKGVGYPASSLDFFCALKEAAAAKRVTPTTLTSWLDFYRQTGHTANLPAVASTLPAQPALPSGPVALPPLLSDAQAARLTQEVFTAQEAAQFLGISVSSLRKYGPKPFARYGRTARWRRSDLLKGQDDE